MASSNREEWCSLSLVIDLARVVPRVQLLSELVSLSKLTFYLKQVGKVTNEQALEIQNILRRRLSRGDLLLDFYRAVDLEVELACFCDKLGQQQAGI